VTMELCGVKALSFAVGAYLPLSTTLPIFIGGAVRWLVDSKRKKSGEEVHEDDELGKGNLFATGLVAGGALAGVIVALLTVNEGIAAGLGKVSAEHGLMGLLGENGFALLGVGFFLLLSYILYKIGIAKAE